MISGVSHSLGLLFRQFPAVDGFIVICRFYPGGRLRPSAFALAFGGFIIRLNELQLVKRAGKSLSTPAHAEIAIHFALSTFFGHLVIVLLKVGRWVSGV